MFRGRFYIIMFDAHQIIKYIDYVCQMICKVNQGRSDNIVVTSMVVLMVHQVEPQTSEIGFR